MGAVARTASVRRWLARQRWTIFDVALALALLLITVDQGDHDSLDWWIFAAPMVAALVIRRRLPVLAVGLATVGTLGHHVWLGGDFETLDLAVPLTLYTLASSDRPRRISMATLFVTVALAAIVSAVDLVRWASRPTVQPGADEPASEPVAKLAELRRFLDGLGIVKPSAGGSPEAPPAVDAPATFGDLLASAAWQTLGLMLVVGFAFAVGDGVRSRRAHLRTLEIRAADLEREQSQRIALATAAERARITRELHDVIAHGLSVIVVQAQGAAAALNRHPDRTAAALQSVITAGRASLAEMRRLLDVVRQDPTDETRLEPQPGIGALPELIDRIRAAGTPVTFTIDGEPVPLAPSVDLSAYRIAQEALTNALKHAGAQAQATVEIRFRTDAVEVDVADDGVGGSEPPTEGGGLRGIAERVAALGGELTVGPGESGGFRVRAVLPLRGPGTDE
jgi:signal transduction histidine kinase